jgi:niacin transporter
LNYHTHINPKKTAFTAILIIAGIIISLFSPVRLVMEPASFTLAIHVPIFIAMFLSPLAAVAVAIGTALGFFIGDYHPVIAWRAVSHVLFAFLGSFYLQYRPQILSSCIKKQNFSFVIGLIHSWTEVIIVYLFYMDSGTPGIYYSNTDAFLFVGLGGLVHSMLDFTIALVIIRILTKFKAVEPLLVTFKKST